MARARVLIFDSGVGGLSILDHIRALDQEQSLALDLRFLTDNQAFPYGTKSEQFLIDRVNRVIDEAVKVIHPQVIVIACNSASTIVLPSLRERLDIPIVGVVPAIKPAAAISKTGVIAVLATQATVERQYTKDLVKQFAVDKQVHLIANNDLVLLAEDFLKGKVGNDQVFKQLKLLFAPLNELADLDTIVLACTHFPLLADQIEEVFKGNQRVITLVDSGAAISRRVQEIISANESPNDGMITTEQAFSTAEIEDQALVIALEQRGLAWRGALLVQGK